ncbi:UDP-glucuronic acid decarboxylase 1 [Neolecta irregularis DAH-3]|uniref:UDP-glucuronic acid decarboxylase 1 n=1 Tax=Neolecta irregularis (strain DAH-3) TaxID=1198029 RepID=A0A1U7LGI2_NEOID|nr:UDP-glucuronic acid decarboxylase 1 [Neolecta irregularis DAH-3]|eukprot:OLL21766.1 UDP-glucuronic acid decarboxylase 1 [Neolecta irregularis DAH-3]
MSHAHTKLAGLYAYPTVIPEIPANKDAKLVLVTGGAGFVGSHVIDRLMLQGHRVLTGCLDNFYTGSKRNIAHWADHPNFCLLSHDITDPLLIDVQFDRIYHLACPASPPHYQSDPIATLKTAFMGTLHMLDLAKRTGARFLLSSTSEIYGDPQVHPQPETYWGNVNSIGPRACYDEGKRVSEALVYSYTGVDIRVARIFNAYGPRLSPSDGRVISNFLTQSIQGLPLSVYGDGSTSRSYQYIHDLVDGLLLLMESQYSLPINIGNTCEYNLIQLANLVIKITGSASDIVFAEAPIDDPHRRRPDISRAKEILGWEPKWDIEQGIRETAEWFRTISMELRPEI